MNYFLTADGIEATDLDKGWLLKYLYKVKNHSQYMYPDEIRAFNEVVDAPNSVFMRKSNTEPTVMPFGIKENSYVCSIDIIAARLESTNDKGFCMVIYEIYNESFEFYASFYMMPLTDWHTLVRKNIIDEFLADNPCATI